MLRRLPVVASFTLVACLNLEVPPAVPKGPGTVQGRVVFAKPGQAAFVPATGTRIRFSSASLELVVDDAEGRFTINGLADAAGDVRFAFDADGDGRPDLQKALSLSAVGAGPGRDIALGDVVLGRNARVVGRARLAPSSERPSGHAGTTVFVPSSPYSTFTADDGSYVLDELPEGTYPVAFHRPGHAPDSAVITIGAGQELRLRDVLLRTVPANGELATVTGSVIVLTGSGDGVTVTVAGSGLERSGSTGADARFQLEGLAPGLHSFVYSKPGWVSALIENVLLVAGSNRVSTVTLHPGPSRPVSLDGGPPRFDGGSGAAGGSAGGMTAGGSAGGMTAGGSAGGMTAGGSAGGMTAGGSAGGMTAGGSAGGMTAGGSAGGMAAGGSAGGMTAGGSAGGMTAGGSALRAVVTPSTLFAAPDASVQLSGAASTGAMPLIYRWTQDGGPGVTLSANDSSSAAMPTFRAPGPGAVLRFALTVEDPSGARSSPALATVSIARPPVAVVTGTDGGLTVALSAAPFSLSGAGSFDRDALVLTARWFQVGGPAGAFAPDNALDTVFTPPAVTQDTLVTVALEVTNSVGLVSPAATRSFNVRPGSAFAWTLDAGPTQVVNVPDTGALVTLNGSVQSSIAGATFDAAWTQLAGPSVSLSFPTSPFAPQFLMPVFSGADQQLLFRMTVTSTSGLSPTSQQADTVVVVRDRVRPRLVSTDVDDGFGGRLSTTLVFSEPVAALPPNSQNINISVRASSSLRTEGTRVYVVNYPPLAENTPYTLNVGTALTDVAGNALLPVTSIQFVARQEWSPLFESASASTLEPRPAIMVLTADAEPVSQVQLIGRRLNASSPAVWALQRFDPFDKSCANDAGVCTVTDAPTPAVSLNPTSPVPPLHKGFQSNGFAATLVQLKDFQGTPETLYLLADGGVFQPSPPGVMFGDGTSLYSTYVDATGLRMVQLDPLTNTWTRNDELVNGNTTLYSNDATSVPLAVGFFELDSPSARRIVFARSSRTNVATPYSRTAVGAWTNPAPIYSQVLSIRAVRSDDIVPGFPGIEVLGAGTSQSTPLYTRSSFTGFSGSIEASAWSIYPSASTFDLAHLNSVVYVAFVANDDLLLRSCVYFGGVSSCPSYTTYLGPSGLQALDANPACSPAHPELSVVRNGLVLTWQERCGGGPWKVYARALR
jgi:hypothetical protein